MKAKLKPDHVTIASLLALLKKRRAYHRSPRKRNLRARFERDGSLHELDDLEFELKALMKQGHHYILKVRKDEDDQVKGRRVQGSEGV